MIIGAHMSITNGYAESLKDSRLELDANALQIFLKSPRGGRPKPLLPEEVEKFHKYKSEYKIDFVVGHSSYLLNLAKDQPADNWQEASLIDDLTRLSALDGQGLVYHVGKHLTLDKTLATYSLIENLKKLLNKTAKLNVPLLLENLSGQGTEMGTKLSELKFIIDKVGDPTNLKVCIDTCHAFAAGYDLTTTKSVDDFFTEIQKTIGINTVVCFHLNDSKAPCGARKDRHENLGKGFIGTEGVQQFIKLANKHNVPLILETPLINNSHLTDIELVRSLAI
jgi:deoxyribonuclease-4